MSTNKHPTSSRSNTTRPYISQPIPLTFKPSTSTVTNPPSSSDHDEISDSPPPRYTPASTPIYRTLTHSPILAQPALIRTSYVTHTPDRDHTYSQTLFSSPQHQPPPRYDSATSRWPANRFQQAENGNGNDVLPVYVMYAQMRLQEESDEEAQRQVKKKRNGCVEVEVGDRRWKWSLAVVVFWFVVVGCVVGVLASRREKVDDGN